MKMFKNTLAVLLSVVMLFSFAACRDKGDDNIEESTQATEQTQETSRTIEEAGLDMKKLCDANKISSLIKKYNVITVKAQNSDGSSFIRQVFRFDDGIADIQKNGDAVTGFIKGFSFTVEKDRMKAYCDLEDLEDGEEFDDDDFIAEYFEEKKLVEIETTEQYYKLKSLSEDKEKSGQRYFTFDKETLALTSVTYKNAVGNTENVEISFNGELEDFAKKITESFDGELKKVTVAGEIVDEDEISYIDVQLSLPADWEYIPSGDGRIDYYMDEAMSENYSYPGHGKDYTLYVSNVFDDEDNGKK